MADIEQPGANHNFSLIVQASTGVRADGPVALYADKNTHRLLVDAGTITTSSASVGATAAVVPTSADYIGGNKAGNLQGLLVGQQTMANSLAVVLASDQTAIPVTGTFFQATQPVSLAVLPALVAGSAVIGHVIVDTAPSTAVTNAGTFAVQASIAASQTIGLVAGSALIGKVGIDQTTPGTTNLVALAANQSVNVAQINGVVPLMNNGSSGTGSQRTNTASDNSAIALWGHAATAATVPANIVYQGLRGSTALPTAVTDGQAVGAMADPFGRRVVLPNGMRDIIGTITQLTLTASTTETSLIAATASTFHDLLSIVVVNTSATATQVDFRDSLAGTIRLTLYVPAGDMRGAVLHSPIPQATVNTAWTAKCTTSVSSVIITGQYVSNK